MPAETCLAIESVEKDLILPRTPRRKAFLVDIEIAGEDFFYESHSIPPNPAIQCSKASSVKTQ